MLDGSPARQRWLAILPQAARCFDQIPEDSRSRDLIGPDNRVCKQRVRVR
jgi:hypothetical protein